MEAYVTERLVLLDAETQRVFRSAYARVNAAAGEWVYGYFHLDDPRDWYPDLEDCTPAEIANWVAACQMTEHGEGVPAYEPPVGGVCRANQSYGVGSYRIPLGPEEQD